MTTATCALLLGAMLLQIANGGTHSSLQIEEKNIDSSMAVTNQFVAPFRGNDKKVKYVDDREIIVPLEMLKHESSFAVERGKNAKLDDTSVQIENNHSSSSLNDLKSSLGRSDYLGCFKDNDDRALKHFKGHGSVEQCKSKCKASGYAFAGRQYNGECWCGDSGYDKHGRTDGCDCDGSMVGPWKNCVYKIEDKSYLGCFKDSGDRALKHHKGHGSVEQCKSKCKAEGYAFAGRQYNGQCWCGDSGYDKHGRTHGCDCDGSMVGPWKNCVYKIGRENYLGCFKDSGDRALKHRNGHGSVEQCNSKCKASGYALAGRQYNGECWCGDSGYDKHGKSSGCDCDGSMVGPWKNCVYKVDKNYLGCFKDSGDRALKHHKGHGSIEQCKSKCKAEGYAFAGRQYNGECWCGNSGYDKHGKSSGCNCNGSMVGPWKNCVYKV